jgi:DNA-binding transcriptional regulator/RsmH inhibitor MraZ
MPTSGLFGTDYEVSVYKQRFVLPIQFQKQISTAAKETFILTAGVDTSIVCYPLDNWKILVDLLKNGSEDEQDDLQHMNYYATETKLEGPGRLKISDDLMKYAQIKDRVRIIGENTLITIIDPELLEIKRKKMQDAQAARSRKRNHTI